MIFAFFFRIHSVDEFHKHQGKRLLDIRLFMYFLYTRHYVVPFLVLSSNDLDCSLVVVLEQKSCEKQSPATIFQVMLLDNFPQ